MSTAVSLTPADRVTARRTLAAAVVWGAAVSAASASGLLQRVAPRAVAPMIVAGIAVPSIAYARSAHMRRLARALGVHRLSLAHAWRILAAYVFWRYERAGKLPPAFARTAGWGDMLAGLAALALVAVPNSRAAHLAFNLVGFADFVSALGTGFTLTVKRDPRMGELRRFPLALIPLFGVGLSGTAHLIAFDLLTRRAETES
jgi:hypothetical protein